MPRKGKKKKKGSDDPAPDPMFLAINRLPVLPAPALPALTRPVADQGSSASSFADLIAQKLKFYGGSCDINVLLQETPMGASGTTGMRKLKSFLRNRPNMFAIRDGSVVLVGDVKASLMPRHFRLRNSVVEGVESKATFHAPQKDLLKKLRSRSPRRANVQQDETCPSIMASVPKAPPSKLAPKAPPSKLAHETKPASRNLLAEFLTAARNLPTKMASMPKAFNYANPVRTHQSNRTPRAPPSSSKPRMMAPVPKASPLSSKRALPSSAQPSFDEDGVSEAHASDQEDVEVPPEETVAHASDQEDVEVSLEETVAPASDHEGVEATLEETLAHASDQEDVEVTLEETLAPASDQEDAEVTLEETASDDLSSDWELVDDDSGPYYFNILTGEKRVDLPSM